MGGLVPGVAEYIPAYRDKRGYAILDMIHNKI